MTPTEAGIPRPAPSAADLAAVVRRALIHTPDANPALDALLARCEEAVAAEALVAELEAALRASSSIVSLAEREVDKGNATFEMEDAVDAYRAALASPQETTT